MERSNYPKLPRLYLQLQKNSTKAVIFIATKHEKTNLPVIYICLIISFIFDS